MNHPHPGFLANYNSLTDKYLAGYFSNTRIRRHLQRSGLISRTGRIISEKEYRLNAMKKDHQKYIRECLAQAIFHKVLDMERHHQVEIKRKHENSMKKERIQRLKVERSRRSAEDTNFLLSPHPPTAPKKHYGRRKLSDRGQSGHLGTYPRPSTAPGNIQHPIRLQPLCSNATTEPILQTASSYRPKFSTCEKGEKNLLRPTCSMDYSSGISPYQLPIINNYVIPIPPPPPKTERNISVMKFGTSRGRRYRPTTAPNGLEQSLMKQDTGKFYKPQIHTNAYVTMIYLGKTVHLCHDLFDCRDEIKIYQQHCGGENVCVYRGKVLEGDTFHFTSKRHHGFPFSLTFYLNGMQVSRLSSCCEYKHRKGTRLGGKLGHFGFVNVERSSPCYKCIIAMGMDKKPFPPKKKLVDADEGKKEDFRGGKVSQKLTDNSISAEENKDSVSMTSSLPEESRVFAQGSIEMEMGAQRLKGARIKWERNLRSVSDYAYDEDFEADEEKSDEKVNEEGQVDDQMNGMSKSPSDDEKDNLDHEKESKNSSQKALQASDSEQDESDGYSESDSEENKQGKAADLEMIDAARKIQSFYRKHKGLQKTQRVQPENCVGNLWGPNLSWDYGHRSLFKQHTASKQGKKCVPSLSSSSLVYSSENDSDHETRKQDDDKDNSDIHSEYENEVQRNEGQETSLEEEENISAAENTAGKNRSSTPCENMMETNLQDIILLRETPKHIGSVDMNGREGREEDLLVHWEDDIPEAEHRSKKLSATEDRGECKSVKVKIAEDIEKDHLLSSEPEDSDSSTEAEENPVSTQYKNQVPDGASLAEELKMLESQKAAVQMEQDKQMVGKERTLEEEELLAEEGIKEVALEDELSAKNVVALSVKQAVKNELQKEETELKKVAVGELGLEMGNVEKDIIYEEGKSYEGKIQLEELKEAVLGDRACKREEILESYELEREEVKGKKLTDGLANEETSDREEVAEEIHNTAAVLESIETVELEERKALGKEVHGVKEIVEETTDADMVKETAFVERGTLELAKNLIEKDEYGGYETLKKREHQEDPGGEAKIIENDITEDRFFEGVEYVNIKLKSDSIVEAQLLASEQEETDIATMDKKEDFSDESLPGRNSLAGEVPSDQEESCLTEEELEETSQEVSNIKILCTRDEIAQEKEKTCMEEPLLDWETEKDILLTEEKNKDHRAIVTTEREEKADKSNDEGDTEKEAIVESRLLVKELTQEEDNLMQAMEEETEEELVEQVPKSDVAGAEIKLVAKKEEFFTEDAVEPEAIVMVTEEIIMNTQLEGQVDAEEAGNEEEAVVKWKVEGGVTKEGRKGIFKGQEEDEEAEIVREVGSKGKAEVEEAEMVREVVIKQKVDAEEAERKVVYKGEAKPQETETEREMSVKGKVDAEKAEAGGKVQTEEPGMERGIVVEEKVDAEEAEARGKVVIKGKMEAEHPETKGEVVSGDVRLKGDIVSEVNIVGGQAATAEILTEAQQVSESSAQVVLEAKEENQERKQSNETRLQDEVEHPEDTLRAEVSVDALLQKEIVTVEDEDEAEEIETEEERMRDEIIPVKYVEEALLFGIQKLITEVSQFNVEAMKDGLEDLVEQTSSHGDSTRENIVEAAIDEKQISQSDNSEERETNMFGKATHLEEKDKSGKSQIKQEESQAENLPATEIFPVNTEHSETEQQQDITAQMIYLEAHISSGIEDRN
ncbi:glutamate-rich protein 3 isoform X3 [Paroedura picta]|uniref:glutamate-rich protein 3 isoform X3 n=1 Tax=Paroedura picta TaxID=143630 RepID=UPI004055B407